jgi:hypothetical protein
MVSGCESAARVRCVVAGRRLPRTLAFVGLLLAGLFVFDGCGSSAGDRLPLGGKVTFQGAPLATGTIEFSSADGRYQSGATLAKGVFSVPAEKGLPPGKYTVRVSSVQESGPAPAGPPGPEAEKHVAKQLIPAKYNAQSELTAEVTKAGSKTLSFDLK